MFDPFDHEPRRLRIWDLDLIYALPALAFIFINAYPAPAMAFVDELEELNQPLIFERDATLADKAITGIDIRPKKITAGQLLRSRRSQIPQAATHLASGMALRVMATGYSSTPDQTDASPFITASGTTVHTGTLATNFLPFGSKLRIGNFIYTVEDRMNARYNGRYIVDIWFPSREAARQFGVRIVEMEIVSIPGK